MRTISATLCIGVCSVSFAAEAPVACRNSPVPIEYQPRIESLATDQLPIADYLDTVYKCRTPAMGGVTPQPPSPPASQWLDAERTRYAGVLAKQSADILVVPFQIQGFGLDRIERAVMAGDLAYAIGDASSYRVADPFLTALALGEGRRRVNVSAAYRLAQQIGARKIVVGYVGHDGNHAFTLTLQVLTPVAAGTPPVAPWQHDWRTITFSDEKTPAFVLHDMLPAVLHELPLQLTTRAAVTAEAQTPARVDTSPVEMVSAGAKSAAPIASLNLLATMLPLTEGLARDRLFERALVGSLRARAASPGSRFFVGYALLNLQRRPTALARITGAQGPAFTALRGLLNGDLPTAQAATREVTNPFEQLLLQIGVRDLEYHYGKDTPTAPSAAGVLFAGTSAATWGPLLALRLEDQDPWFVADAMTVKEALDAAFPAKGFDVASLVQGNRVARDRSVDEIDIDLASARHLRHVTEQLEAPQCCHSQELRPGKWDLLWMLQGMAEARIERRLDVMVSKQGRPEAAIDAIARYEPVYDGLPALSAASASASASAALKSPDDVRASWSARASRDALAAASAAQGQNPTGLAAVVSMGVPLPTPGSAIWVDAYGYDYPRRPYWPYWFFGAEQESNAPQLQAFLAEGFAFSTDNPRAFGGMQPGNLPGQRDAVLATLGARFTGHPARPGVSPEERLEAATPENRVAMLRKMAADDPTKYRELGQQILITGGKYADAQAAFLAYPNFHTGNALDPVRLSNVAQDIGSLWYWLGESELAKPFFKIAANLNTGSAASIGSAQRLLMLQGDYAGAAELALERASRYSDSFAYRDYFSFLHALGEHDAAWAGFSQIRAELNVPQVWLSALVGHHMQGLDERAVRAWLQTPEIRDAHFKTQRFASYYAVAWNTTDRVPPADLGALVEQLEGPATGYVKEGVLYRPHPVDPGSVELVIPNFVAGGKRVQLPAGTHVKSERAYFADAYSAVARGDYPAAVTRFSAMANLYPMGGAYLAYFSYAVSKAGDTVQLETYVNEQDPHNWGDFDVLLARAFLAAGRKNVDEAYQLLRRAFRVKPRNLERPVIAEYQYAQACEWLYRDTQDSRFAAELLDWVKNHQTIQPAFAWAYAIQYSYEKNPEARLRALAMTLYLDPASERIKGAPAAEVAKAKAWLATNNPFRRGKKPDRDTRNTSAALAPTSLFRTVQQESRPTR